MLLKTGCALDCLAPLVFDQFYNINASSHALGRETLFLSSAAIAKAR